MSLHETDPGESCLSAVAGEVEMMFRNWDKVPFPLGPLAASMEEWTYMRTAESQTSIEIQVSRSKDREFPGMEIRRTPQIKGMFEVMRDDGVRVDYETS
jgi:hypothetical protein